MIRLATIDADELAPHYQAALARLDNLTTVTDVTSDVWSRETLANVDAVVVNSPLSKRADVVRSAAQQGKHVLVNAPLACSVQARQEVVQSCRAAGVGLMVSNPMRFMPYQQTVKQSVGEDQIGTAGLLRIHHWHPKRSEGPNNESILEISAREVDLACWMFDAYPDFVYATPFGDVSAGLGAQVHLGFPAGGMALIDCAHSLPQEATPYYSLTMVGSTGAAYADDHRNTNLLIGNQTHGLTVDQGHQWIHNQLTQFIDVIKSNQIVDEMERAFAVTQAALSSLSSKRSARFSGGCYELH